jgi:hypothetical protein
MPFHLRRILLALGFAASLWPSLARSEPRVVVGPTEYDFGGVRRGEKVVRTFRLHNAGDTPLELTGVHLSKLGMAVKLPEKVEPGADGSIALEWTTDRVQGSVRGVAVVNTNDPRARSVTLALTGVVRGPLDIEPVPAVFLSAFRGEDLRRELTLRSNQPGPATMRLHARDGAHHVADLETIEPGRSWRLTVKPAPATPPGRYEDTLTIESDDPAIGRLRLPVHVFVKADVYANPDVIHFGEVPLRQIREQPGAAQLLEQLVMIKKRAGTFRIRGIRSDVAALELRATPTSRDSGSFRIDAGLRLERLEPGSIDGTIRIETDDPEFPHVTVRVHGRVVEK